MKTKKNWRILRGVLATVLILGIVSMVFQSYHSFKKRESISIVPIGSAEPSAPHAAPARKLKDIIDVTVKGSEIVKLEPGDKIGTAYMVDKNVWVIMSIEDAATLEWIDYEVPPRNLWEEYEWEKPNKEFNAITWRLDPKRYGPATVAKLGYSINPKLQIAHR